MLEVRVGYNYRGRLINIGRRSTSSHLGNLLSMRYHLAKHLATIMIIGPFGNFRPMSLYITYVDILLTATIAYDSLDSTIVNVLSSRTGSRAI